LYLCRLIFIIVIFYSDLSDSLIEWHYVYGVTVQKYHTIDGRRCEVKKALSKLEMRNLKDGGGMPGQGMPWQAGGCGQAGGNMCNVGPPMNYGVSCNVGGFGPNCNFGGAGMAGGKCGVGMNSGNQMGGNYVFTVTYVEVFTVC